jgi:hypothetical protein
VATPVTRAPVYVFQSSADDVAGCEVAGCEVADWSLVRQVQEFQSSADDVAGCEAEVRR